MIDKALYIMLLKRVNSLFRQVGGVRPLKISTFWGPKWHSSNGSMPFNRAQKILNFRAPTIPLPLSFVMDLPASGP